MVKYWTRILPKFHIYEFYNTPLYRDYGASAIINRDLLWVTGGYIYINGAYVTTDTTEFIRLDQPTLPGPNLPEKFTKHCIAKVGVNSKLGDFIILIVNMYKKCSIEALS